MSGHFIGFTDPQIVESSSSLILNESKQRGCLRVFGLLFLGPGLLVTGLALHIIPSKEPLSYGTPEWAACLLLGLAFIAAGGWLVFAAARIVFDGQRLCLRLSGGSVFGLRDRLTVPFAEFQNLILTREEETDDSFSHAYYYILALETSRGRLYPVARFTRLPDAFRLAGKLVSRHGLTLLDKTMSQARSMTVSDIDKALALSREATSRIPSRDAMKTLVFCKVPGAGAGWSSLERAEYKGGVIFRVTYPKQIIQRVLITACTLYFFSRFINWDIASYMDFYQDFWSIKLTAETAFTGGFFIFAFLLLVVIPVFSLLAEFIKAPRRAILFVEADVLSIKDTYGRAVQQNARDFRLTMRRDDIDGLEIKAAGKQAWKVAKLENCLLIRTRQGIVRAAQGLDEAGLLILQDQIAGIMKLK